MSAIFSQRGRYRLYVEIEAALAAALAEVGVVPAAAAAQIAAVAEVGVAPERVAELEADTRHELAAVIQAFSAACGEAGRWVHYGATSSDVLDTAMAVQLDRALGLVMAELRGLLISLAELAERTLDVVTIGRTHGQHALPTTFGFKVANWLDELARHWRRVTELRPRVCVGKMSGAVGTFAGFGERGVEVEASVMRRLGIRAGSISTQIVHRDRFAEWACTAAMLGGTLEMMATEVRNLQRTEIAEVREPFGRARQVGSSTMPHKRNPVLAENVCSLGRLLRGLVIPALENMVYWHERDLANSANERFSVSMTAMLVEEMVRKSRTIFAGLEVDDERMRLNVARSPAAFVAEAVMLALVDAGLRRLDAYEVMRTIAHAGGDYRAAIAAEPIVHERIDRARLDQLLDPTQYLGAARARARLVVDEVRAALDAPLGDPQPRGVP